MLFYLRNDPAMRKIASKACLWDNAPTNDGHDTGVDIVCDHDGATAEANGRPRYWAVQCKDYGKKVDLKDLATLWMKSADERYAGRMVFSTAEFTDNVRRRAAKDGTLLVGPATMAQSSVDWNALFTDNGHATRDTYDLREHQRDAVRDINAKLESHDRCKAIMACGTGKTLMSLRLAEGRCPHGLVLFAAPSIALVSQAMREWTNQDRVGLRPLVVCSDATASQTDGEDDLISTVSDLAFPASTSASDLRRRYDLVRRRDPEAMVVVFTTYQPMKVIADAQVAGLPAFDLAICDGAHGTTGAAETGDDVTAFMLVHDESRVHARKRVYMTATPRIYDDNEWTPTRAPRHSTGWRRARTRTSAASSPTRAASPRAWTCPAWTRSYSSPQRRARWTSSRRSGASCARSRARTSATSSFPCSSQRAWTRPRRSTTRRPSTHHRPMRMANAIGCMRHHRDRAALPISRGEIPPSFRYVAYDDDGICLGAYMSDEAPVIWPSSKVLSGTSKASSTSKLDESKVFRHNGQYLVTASHGSIEDCSQRSRGKPTAQTRLLSRGQNGFQPLEVAAASNKTTGSLWMLGHKAIESIRFADDGFAVRVAPVKLVVKKRLVSSRLRVVTLIWNHVNRANHRPVGGNHVVEVENADELAVLIDNSHEVDSIFHGGVLGLGR